MALQFTFTRGRSLRGLRSWIARAISSFPVPVSPKMSTVASVGAICSTLRSTARSAGLLPTISTKLCSVRISSCRYTFSASSRAFRAAISSWDPCSASAVCWRSSSAPARAANILRTVIAWESSGIDLVSSTAKCPITRREESNSGTPR